MKGNLPELNQVTLILQFQPNDINALVLTKQQQCLLWDLTSYPTWIKFKQFTLL